VPFCDVALVHRTFCQCLCYRYTFGEVISGDFLSPRQTKHVLCPVGCCVSFAGTEDVRSAPYMLSCSVCTHAHDPASHCFVDLHSFRMSCPLSDCYQHGHWCTHSVWYPCLCLSSLTHLANCTWRDIRSICHIP
jgi:hypothetical protein